MGHCQIVSDFIYKLFDGYADLICNISMLIISFLLLCTLTICERRVNTLENFVVTFMLSMYAKLKVLFRIKMHLKQ